MSTLKILDCDNDYRYQGPRFIRLGPDSGEEFREEYLIPWLEKNINESELNIDFEGTIVYTPSFLEESFGGAIRKGFEIVRKLHLMNIPDDTKQQVEKYIKNARQH